MTETSKSFSTVPVAGQNGRVLKTAERAAVPWGLVVLLSLLFLVFWLLPQLDILKNSETVFPLALHTIEETFAIVVAIMVFAVSWNAYGKDRPGNILVLACGFLAVSLLDFAHMLSYKGMPDFVTPADVHKAIVFWLGARYAASITLLIAALRAWQPLVNSTTRYRFLGISLSITAAIYYVQLYRPELLPLTFVPGQGLTPIKIMAEYGIVGILMVTAVLLYGNVQREQSADATHLFTATLITILSELCFTLYSNVNDIFQLLGHTYKVIAYFYIYKAVFVSSVQEPYRRLSAEIAEREQAEARIEYLAYHDPLTELPNRLLVRNRFADAALNAQQTGSKVALVFIDLDNFKNVNDSLGHAVGDAMLRKVSARLRDMTRNIDTLSRQGGDEFLLVLAAQRDTATIMPILDALVDQMQAPLIVQEQELGISVSIGVAVFPDDGRDFDTLLKKADTAMYKAKGAGRNTYRFFSDEMLRDTADRLRIRNGLRQALDRGEFRLYYQPQVSLEDGHVTGVEALIRWQHPELGLVPPGRFIDVAEGCGLIVPMGEWVLREACRQMAAWHGAGLPKLSVAVNLSGMQFLRGDLEKSIVDALAASGLPPHCLELELTESILIQDTENMLNIVKRLDKLGIQMSIDDFGTGYSSLSYLKRFRVDKLKIDQSFIRALASAPEDDAIVRAVIQLASSLGLRTIAEGVETAETAELLRKLGCEEAQGYYYAKPMPAAEVEAYFRQSLAR